MLAHLASKWLGRLSVSGLPRGAQLNRVQSGAFRSEQIVRPRRMLAHLASEWLGRLSVSDLARGAQLNRVQSGADRADSSFGRAEN